MSRSALCACPDLARFGDTEPGLVGAHSPAGGQGCRSGGAGVRPVARRRGEFCDPQPQRRSGAVAGWVEAADVVRRQPGTTLGRIGRVGQCSVGREDVPCLRL